MKIAYNHIGTKKTINYVIFGLIFTLFSISAKSQENPPIPIQVEVRTARNLNFGAFTAGTSGGNVSVSWDSQRVVDGDIFELTFGGPVSSAIFDVYANPGTIIQIQDYGETELNNGSGGIIYLTIDSFSTGQNTFITQMPNNQTTNEVFVGGTLRIPADNSGTLSGKYNGTFTLTFIQQ
jgi:hypothetical protein